MIFVFSCVSDGSDRGRPMRAGAVLLDRSRLFLLFTLPHKTLSRASQFTGLPLHFLVLGFVAAPFSTSKPPRNPRSRSLNLSNGLRMDDDLQRYASGNNRDRLCVNSRLLSPLNLPATREASLCEERGDVSCPGQDAPARVTEFRCTPS